MRRSPPLWARRWARPILWTLFLIGVSPVLAAALGAVGTKLGWFDWRTGFGDLTVGWAPKLAYFGVAAGLIAIVVATLARARRLWVPALLALIAPAMTLAAFSGLKQTAARFPGHDIATDWLQPLAFSPRVMALRGPDANPVHPDPRSVWNNPEVENWVERRAHVINADLCPGAKSTRLGGTQAEVHARVLAAMRDEGLTILTDAPAEGRIEGVATSFWFEFKDDVAARITRDGGAWLADFRSVSRVGGSDLGANCARVTRLAETLYPPRRDDR